MHTGGGDGHKWGGIMVRKLNAVFPPRGGGEDRRDHTGTVDTIDTQGREEEGLSARVWPEAPGEVLPRHLRGVF